MSGGGERRQRTVGLEPVPHVVDRRFADVVEQGDGDLDHGAIIRVIGRQNGLKIARRPTEGDAATKNIREGK